MVEEQVTRGNVDNPFEKKHATFVYGTLKAGFGNADLLTGGSTFIGTALTKDPKWAMISYHGFPAVIPGKKNLIMGELYICDSMTLDELDVLECNGSLYAREKIEVVLTEDDTAWDAWVYVLCPHRIGKDDDPDKYIQPGVKQYQFSDDDETDVDCWEPEPPEPVVMGRAQPIEFTRIDDKKNAVIHYVDNNGEVLTSIATTHYRESRRRSDAFFIGPSPRNFSGMVSNDVALAAREAETRIRDARAYADLPGIDANRKQWAEAVLASLRAAGEDDFEGEEDIEIDVSAFATPNVVIRETLFVRDTH